MRLLESLKHADFSSSPPPRLTIELPQKVDADTKRYLERFTWPPNHGHNEASLLSLHHRIPQSGLTAQENSIRFLEAFWPANPATSHLLVLSPQAELSPLFFHYLKYSMLGYKYSKNPSNIRDKVLGISLESPSSYLNGSGGFVAPLMQTSSGDKSPIMSPFLWQAPNSQATLYFGDKWVELHDFVTQLLSKTQLSTPADKEKLVSKTYPSWLEHILELARIRGYAILYPNFEGPDSLVTLHTDLYHPPEEYAEDPEVQSEHIKEGTKLTADPAQHMTHKHTETPLASRSLLSMLPFDGVLPKLAEVPLVSWDGVQTTYIDLWQGASYYRETFRRDFGGCDSAHDDGDLFCERNKKPEEEGEREEGRENGPAGPENIGDLPAQDTVPS